MSKATRPGAARARRRLIWSLALALVFLAGVHYYLVGPLSVATLGTGGASDLAGVREAGAHRPLSGLERARLARQRALVADLARRHVGSQPTGTRSDLRLLQQILDRGVLEPDQTFELQALGVAFGDVLAAELGLDWIAFEDALGRNRALRLDDTDVVLFPVTMISKRVEAGIDVSLDALWREAERTVAEARRRGRRPDGPISR